MDARHFDAVSRALSEAGTRRGLLGLLAALPVVGGLFAILDADELDAHGRRHRRRVKSHKHGKRRRRKHGKKRCKPEAVAQTCAGKCGSITNNCKKPVDCGSCDCNPPCGACFTCQGQAGSPGACVPRDAGTPCGPATTCTDGTLQPQGACNGSGACEAPAPVPCAPYTQCDGDACATTCVEDHDCVAGSFCDAGQCVGDQDDGEPCDHGGQCRSGFCVDGVCCDTACDGECQACNIAGAAGTCTAEADDAICNEDNHCCAGACTHTRTDEANCGVCGRVCASLPLPHTSASTCTAGACVLTCDAGYANCDGNAASGCETPLGTTSNCGSCGDLCGQCYWLSYSGEWKPYGYDQATCQFLGNNCGHGGACYEWVSAACQGGICGSTQPPSTS